MGSGRARTCIAAGPMRSWGCRIRRGATTWGAACRGTRRWQHSSGNWNQTSPCRGKSTRSAARSWFVIARAT
eukprot:7621220-Alexandrium_andersonii.AAC.1